MLKSLPTQPAFYKQYTEPSEFWSVGLNKVESTNYTLLIENHAEYTYPVDGWNYYETPPAAFVTWYNENLPPDPEE